jgi:glycosyltransferase involved in cell wall biosynthesis
MLVSILTACLPSSSEFLQRTASSIPSSIVTRLGTVDTEWVVCFDGPGNVPSVTAPTKTIFLTASSHEGISPARNRALLASSGEWIVVLDADDTLIKSGVKTLLEHIVANPTLGWGAGLLSSEDGRCLDPFPLNPVKFWDAHELVDNWTIPPVFTPAIAFMRKDLLLACNGFPGLAVLEDRLPVFAVSDLAPGVTVSDSTHVYFRHLKQVSSSENHNKSRFHSLNFTQQVLTARRKLVNPNALEVKPRRADLPWGC